MTFRGSINEVQVMRLNKSSNQNQTNKCQAVIKEQLTKINTHKANVIHMVYIEK